MVQKVTLDNGATLLIDEMQDVRSLALGVFVGAGSGAERPSKQRHVDRYVFFLQAKDLRGRRARRLRELRGRPDLTLAVDEAGNGDQRLGLRLEILAPRERRQPAQPPGAPRRLLCRSQPSR